VGSEAGELIHVLSTIMQAKVSARPIVDGEYVHPTFSEGLQTLVMKLKRFSLSVTVRDVRIISSYRCPLLRRRRGD
jgi:hypothetical protein